MHSRYYKHFAKHACDFSLILLEPCNFLYKFNFVIVYTSVNAFNLSNFLFLFNSDFSAGECAADVASAKLKTLELWQMIC